MIAIYPGSFDPITLGHLDLIQRSSILFEKVIVAVLKNPNKTPFFTIEKRVQQIQECTANIKNIEVDSFSGLTVEYAQKKQAGVLLRGLRVMSDFEQELQMAHINKTLENKIETVFLATNTELSFISSSVVKEIAKFGGSIDHLVTSNIAQDLYSNIRNK
ncbi:pantetheine-phosphate adenylyltransferase [Geminocystis sp. NIES-3709]|uniref:pantetheine-phosphate adenylyltransferase n=1 Tax=Geminocystis sp. NIES-3709 TaxID=1617448 RepID=UPI0005FC5F80|nr:pantetheine-phosphate adenylyltransferase [Geminocystis sp. NIES-3709]BAQ63755.1 phosphopantetheine adenylyltransferase [Geminocystis sp. NIES-3709]